MTSAGGDYWKGIMRKSVGKLVVFGVLSMVMMILPTTADAGVKVEASCGAKAAVKRPGQIVFYCGDNGMFATGLSWRSWGGTRAKGLGTITWKICRPDCASGGFHESRGKVTLYRKMRCHGQVFRYSRLRVKAFDGPTRKVKLTACGKW